MLYTKVTKCQNCHQRSNKVTNVTKRSLKLPRSSIVIKVTRGYHYVTKRYKGSPNIKIDFPDIFKVYFDIC